MGKEYEATCTTSRGGDENLPFIRVTVKNAQDGVFWEKSSASADLQGLSLRVTTLSSSCALSPAEGGSIRTLAADGVRPE